MSNSDLTQHHLFVRKCVSCKSYIAYWRDESWIVRTVRNIMPNCISNNVLVLVKQLRAVCIPYCDVPDRISNYMLRVVNLEVERCCSFGPAVAIAVSMAR
jgi:hypothetical protein